MNFTYFIGVDVSKNKLDFAVFKAKDFVFHKVIVNQKDDIHLFMKELKKMEGFSLNCALFCMEHTGIYNNPLLAYLHKKKGNICLEAATQIKNSMGNIRGKNDKIDAKRIGEYAYKNREEIKLWTPKREIIEKLARLTVLRDRLLGVKKQLRVPIEEQENFVSKSVSNIEKKICQRTLNSVESDLEKVDKKIEEIIRSDERLSHLFSIITSVQAIGTQTALQIIIRTNEFKSIRDAKKFACYSGVVPFAKESGIFKGKARVSFMANKKMKTLLHMAALSAITYNTDLKKYYLRKTEEGKNKMSIINAIRNKLIHRIFTCVNEDRKYENIYINSVV